MKKIEPDPPAARALAQIAELQAMTTERLRERWDALIGGPPPSGRQTLLPRLIYRVQELALGGLSKATVKRLDAIADADSGKTPAAAPVAGTVFRREWSGEVHEVTAGGDGFAYRGRKYKSLSAVANAITGQHWSGNLFFGVTSRRKGGRK